MKARAFLYILLLFLVQHITFGESMGGWALAPENVVIVANKDAWHSLELAKYYLKKRNIPPDNLMKLNAGGRGQRGIADLRLGASHRKSVGKCSKLLHKEQVKKQTTGFQRPHKFEVLRQLCNLIPPFLVSKIAKRTGVDKKARTFSPWSHVVAMVYAQLTHAISLNDVCDALRLFSGPLSAIRGATGPSPNALSHANRVRDAHLAEQLLWEQMDHLQTATPAFVIGRQRLPRFERRMYAVDSTVIRLVANCMSWAKHRRRKAATKLHMRLDLQSLLPRFATA